MLMLAWNTILTFNLSPVTFTNNSCQSNAAMIAFTSKFTSKMSQKIGVTLLTFFQVTKLSRSVAQLFEVGLRE